MGCRFSKSEKQPRPDEGTEGEVGVAESASTTIEGSETASRAFTSLRSDVSAPDDELVTLLVGIGLPQYVEAFRSSGYDDLSVLANITEKDIRDIEAFSGVTVLPGHRKKIILAGRRLGGDDAATGTPPVSPARSAGLLSPRTSARAGDLASVVSEEENALFLTCKSDDVKLDRTRSAAAAVDTGGAGVVSAAPIAPIAFDAIDSVAGDSSDDERDLNEAGSPRVQPKTVGGGDLGLSFSARSPYKVQVDSFRLSRSNGSTPAVREKENVSPRGAIPAIQGTLPASPKSPSTTSAATTVSPRTRAQPWTPASGSLPYKRTMTAIEESMRSRVAFLSATMIRRPGGGEGRSGDRRGEKRRARMRQFETLEDGVRATEYQVKKRIADIIERKWSNTNRGL